MAFDCFNLRLLKIVTVDEILAGARLELPLLQEAVKKAPVVKEKAQQMPLYSQYNALDM